MVSYSYAWTPVVIVVGTVVLLTNAYLALIALMIVSFVALAAIVMAPFWLIRSVGRWWRERSGTPRAGGGLSLAERENG
jgi:hypothetical protein